MGNGAGGTRALTSADMASSMKSSSSLSTLACSQRARHVSAEAGRARERSRHVHVHGYEDPRCVDALKLKAARPGFLLRA
eukprot:942709-Rhodomonas_salina.1